MNYSREAIQEQANALARDGYRTASDMLHDLMARCMPWQQPAQAWQQELQAEQVKLGLMPDTAPNPNVQNVDSNDGPASEDYAAPADTGPGDAPSSEEPSA